MFPLFVVTPDTLPAVPNTVSTTLPGAAVTVPIVSVFEIVAEQEAVADGGAGFGNRNSGNGGGERVDGVGIAIAHLHRAMAFITSEPASMTPPGCSMTPLSVAISDTVPVPVFTVPVMFNAAG